MPARLSLVFCVIALVLAGCGAPSKSGPPTPTPVPELSATDFYNVASWVASDPRGCAAYLDSYGTLIHQNARYYPHNQTIHYGLTYLATVEKYRRRHDWADTKAAADLMKAWASS